MTRSLMLLLKREPAMLGAATLITLDGAAILANASSTAQGVLHGITAAWVAWGIRCLSTPNTTAQAAVAEAEAAGDAKVETAATGARHQALAEVASLARIPAKPAKRARKKAAARAR